MKEPNFPRLCISLCQSAGVPVPRLDPDAAGNTLLLVTVDDVEIAVAYEPGVTRNDIKLEASLGEFSSKDMAAASQALADIGTLMHWHRRGSFVRDEDTGTVVFRYVYPLEDASGADLYVCLRALAEIIQAWQENRSLETKLGLDFESMVSDGRN